MNNRPNDYVETKSTGDELTLSSDAVLGGMRAELERHKKSTELLKEIESWLCFNTEPSKENIYKLKADIKKHISEHFS